MISLKQVRFQPLSWQLSFLRLHALRTMLDYIYGKVASCVDD